MPTTLAYQVMDYSDEHSYALSTHRTEQEADLELVRVQHIMKFRGMDPSYYEVREFVLPDFGATIQDLEPGEMFRSTADSVFRKCEQMLDMHYIGNSWFSKPDLVLEDYRYSDDKRNRSLERLATLLEYARARCLAHVKANEDYKYSIYWRRDWVDMGEDLELGVTPASPPPMLRLADLMKKFERRNK